MSSEKAILLYSSKNNFSIYIYNLICENSFGMVTTPFIEASYLDLNISNSIFSNYIL